MHKKRFFLKLLQAIVASILLIMFNSNIRPNVDLFSGNVHEQGQRKSLILLFKRCKIRVLMLRIMLKLFLIKLGLGILFSLNFLYN